MAAHGWLRPRGSRPLLRFRAPVVRAQAHAPCGSGVSGWGVRARRTGGKAEGGSPLERRPGQAVLHREPRDAVREGSVASGACGSGHRGVQRSFPRIRRSCGSIACRERTTACSPASTATPPVRAGEVVHLLHILEHPLSCFPLHGPPDPLHRVPFRRGGGKEMHCRAIPPPVAAWKCLPPGDLVEAQVVHNQTACRTRAAVQQAHSKRSREGAESVTVRSIHARISGLSWGGRPLRGGQKEH